MVYLIEVTFVQTVGDGNSTMQSVKTSWDTKLNLLNSSSTGENCTWKSTGVLLENSLPK